MNDTKIPNTGFAVFTNLHPDFQYVSITGWDDSGYPIGDRGPTLGTRRQVDELVAALQEARDRVFPA